MATAGCFSDSRFIDMIKITEVMIMETKNIILKLRTERGMSQDELADKIMVTRQAVSRWKMEIRFQILIHLSSYRKNLMFPSIRFWENPES